VDVAKFTAAFRSFGVNTNVGQAEQKAVDYRILGVPALTIAGKYMVEGGEHAKMLSTSGQLIAMERAGTKKSGMLIPAIEAGRCSKGKRDAARRLGAAAPR
jgi:thiol:disulfide interchange protein DsbA